MIKRLIPLLFLVFAQASLAQNLTDASNVAREELRTQKAALMTQAMRLNVAQSGAFWPIYREYENELDKVIAERIELIRNYAGNFEIMNDEKAKVIAKKHFKIEHERLNLREKYYKRMAKELGPLIAARFAQVDGQVNTLLNLEIMQMVPLIATPEELGLAAPATE